MGKHGTQVLTMLRAAFFLLPAVFHGSSPAAQEPSAPPSEIRVSATRNPGNVRYDVFYDLQERLVGYLPPEPRLFDLMQRISFTRLSLAEQDAYDPGAWAVSIIGDGLDETLPMRRGGYFRLPYLAEAYKGRAMVMFKAQSKRNYTDTAWVMRIGENRRLSYADFGKAIGQLRDLQAAIPRVYAHNYRVEKFSLYDGLKACFLAPGGGVLIDGRPTAHAIVGDCWVLRLDPNKVDSGQTIEFRGALDIVTLIETEPYLRARF
jgi:hypothetical protein